MIYLSEFVHMHTDWDGNKKSHYRMLSTSIADTIVLSELSLCILGRGKKDMGIHALVTE